MWWREPCQQHGHDESHRTTWGHHRVTRFGKISPIWQNLQSLGQFFEGLFIIWEHFGPTLANIVCNWASFHWRKWPNVEKQVSHLVTLVHHFELLSTMYMSSFIVYIEFQSYLSTVFLNGPTPASFLFIFVLFKYNFTKSVDFRRIRTRTVVIRCWSDT